MKIKNKTGWNIGDWLNENEVEFETKECCFNYILEHLDENLDPSFSFIETEDGDVEMYQLEEKYKTRH